MGIQPKIPKLEAGPAGKAGKNPGYCGLNSPLGREEFAGATVAAGFSAGDEEEEAREELGG